MFPLLVISVFLILPYSSLSWDLAVATPEEIELLGEDGALNVTIAAQLHSIGDVTYDPSQSHVYVTDSSHEKYSVFRVFAPAHSDNPSAKVEPVVTKQAHGIKNLAFDSILSILFWTTGGHTRSISWMKIPTPDEEGGGLVPEAGNILHSFQKEVPHGIVVDSCRRYIFWTNVDYNNPSIGRSDINGRNKKTIVSSDINYPISITIDIIRGLIYWTDEQDMEFLLIKQANLDGQEQKVIYTGRSQVPNSISVGFGHIYFTERANVWAVSLMRGKQNQTTLLKTFATSTGSLAIMSSDIKYYSYENNSQCVFPVKPKHTAAQSSTEDPFTRAQTTLNKDGTRVVSGEILGEETSVLLSSGERGNLTGCHHNGVWLNGSCFCKDGYHGARCELSLACQHYCVRGSCEVDVDGVAVCTCPLQYRGARCEIDACAGLCQNGGSCLPVDINQTHCECAPGYYGAHCEESELLCQAFCALRNDVRRFMLAHEPSSSCKCEKYHESVETESNQLNIDLENGTESLTITSHEDNSRSATVSNILYGLGVVCALLMATVLYLSMRIHKLSKRPRIKKRIIVNKTTPLTARPQSDQCEITIENCCNMNICETPCFEPEFRTPIVKSGSSQKSVEKRTLLDNMEDPTSGGDFSS